MRKIIYLLKYLNYYKNQKNTYKISVLKCIKAFFRGFTPEEYYMYNLDKNNINDYLSEFKRLYYREKINGRDYTIMLDNKVLFKLLTSNLFNSSVLVYWKNSNYLYNENNEIVNLDDLINKLDGAYIIKPINYGGGKGILKIICKENEYYINENKVTLTEIKKELESRNSFIIEKFVKQAKYAENIYSESANTIRIITIKDESGNIEIVKAIHRFGTEKSKPTDNYSSCGIASNIDILTGKIGKCRSRMNNILIEKHPDTNKNIEGIITPNWDEIKKNIIENHYKISFLKFISWDVLITEEDYVILEANASCSADFLQIEEGIKKNQKIYELYKKIGALK